MKKIDPLRFLHKMPKKLQRFLRTALAFIHIMRNLVILEVAKVVIITILAMDVTSSEEERRVKKSISQHHLHLVLSYVKVQKNSYAHGKLYIGFSILKIQKNDKICHYFHKVPQQESLSFPYSISWCRVKFGQMTTTNEMGLSIKTLGVIHKPC